MKINAMLSRINLEQFLLVRQVYKNLINSQTKQYQSYLSFIQINQSTKKQMKLHYCTDIPIQYRYKKIKSVITALGLQVADTPRETFADLRQLSSIPTLPLLETPQGNFTSSNTIIRYLATKAENKLYGKDLHEKALIDQWLDITQCDFDTCALAVNVYVDGKEVDIEAVTTDAEKYLTFLNKHLKNRNFIVGQSLTIADLAVASTIAPVLANMYGQEERKKFGIISTWFHKIAQQNKDIQPKELPKKINKKFEKKKDKHQQEKGKDGKDAKDGKGKQKQKGKAKQQNKEKEKVPKDEKQKKGKKNDAGKQKKEENVKQQPKKQQNVDDDDDIFGDNPVPRAPKQAPKQAPKKPEVKKEVKKKAAAKSIVVFHVKVFEQEQDLNALADKIRTQIKQDGLVWNPNIQIKPIAFGMNMLEIGCVIEDDKVSVEEDIYTKILAWQNQVQSVDTVNFQKL